MYAQCPSCNKDYHLRLYPGTAEAQWLANNAPGLPSGEVPKVVCYTCIRVIVDQKDAMLSKVEREAKAAAKKHKPVVVPMSEVIAELGDPATWEADHGKKNEEGLTGNEDELE